MTARAVLAPVSVFVVAFVVRLAHILESRGSVAAGCLVVDERYYSEWGRAIARGDWLGGRDVFEVTPLYAYVLGLMYRFISTDLFVVRLIQITIGALGCVLLYAIARVMLGGRVPGIVAGLAGALYGPFVFHDGAIMKEALGVFLILLTVFLVLRARQHSVGWMVGAGATLALGAMVRENMLLLVPALAGYLWLTARSARARVLRAGALLAGVVVVLAPVAVRNYVVGGELVLITSGGGAEFWIGHNAMADGTYRVPDFVRPTSRLEHEDFRIKARELTGQPLTRRQASRFWFDESLRFMREHPGREAWLLARKTWLFWNAYEFPDNQNYVFERSRSRTLGGPLLEFAVIAPLALVGLALSLRRPRRFGLAWVVVGVYMVSILLFFIYSRFRLPAVPFLIIFAVYAVVWGVDHVRRRRVAPVAVALVGCVVAWVFTSWDAVGADPSHRRFDVAYTNLAGCYADAGRIPEARELFRHALEINPRYGGALIGLGNIAYVEGRLDEARRAYLAALEVSPRAGEARNGLGSISLSAGDVAGAAREYAAAVALDPRNPAYVTNLGFALLRQGFHLDAARAYRTALSLAPDFANAHWGLAEAWEKRGDIGEAAAEWRRYLAVTPSEEWKARARTRLERLETPGAGR